MSKEGVKMDTTESIPVAEWTDDEWLRAIREFPQEQDYREVEKKVAEWRLEKQEKET
jgi:hypothetical protein